MNSEILERKTSHWIYFYNPKAVENKKKIKIEQQKKNHSTIGKYMFFSDNKERLIDLAKKILVEQQLYNAKVPLSDDPTNSQGFGFVLCVYDSEPTLKFILKKYIEEGINYRYWKKDSDTLKGKYSEKYIKNKRNNKKK